MHVYVDLDGVGADFFTEIEKLQNVAHYSQANKLDTISKIKGTDFFSRLPKLPNIDLLIETVVDLFGEYSILSTPLPGDTENTIKHKEIWIEKNLILKPKQAIFTEDKHLYAKGNLLIDDYMENIKKWEEHGGIGVKYKALSRNYTINDIVVKLHEIKQKHIPEYEWSL